MARKPMSEAELLVLYHHVHPVATPQIDRRSGFEIGEICDALFYFLSESYGVQSSRFVKCVVDTICIEGSQFRTSFGRYCVIENKKGVRFAVSVGQGLVCDGKFHALVFCPLLPSMQTSFFITQQMRNEICSGRVIYIYTISEVLSVNTLIDPTKEISNKVDEVKSECEDGFKWVPRDRVCELRDVLMEKLEENEFEL